jgi:hypothetical protein
MRTRRVWIGLQGRVVVAKGERLKHVNALHECFVPLLCVSQRVAVAGTTSVCTTITSTVSDHPLPQMAPRLRAMEHRDKHLLLAPE